MQKRHSGETDRVREKEKTRIDEREGMAEGKDSKNVITEKKRQVEDVTNEGGKGNGNHGDVTWTEGMRGKGIKRKNVDNEGDEGTQGKSDKEREGN